MELIPGVLVQLDSNDADLGTAFGQYFILCLQAVKLTPSSHRVLRESSFWINHDRRVCCYLGCQGYS